MLPFGLSASDLVGPIVSAIGAAASWYYFWRTQKLTLRAADRAIYLDGHKFLIEICKQLTADPSLWLIYDDHPLHSDNSIPASTPQFRAKLEAFAHLHLNMFEIILTEVPEPARGGEQNPSNIWLAYFYDTLARCSAVRRVLEQAGSDKIWNELLLDLYRKWKKTAGVS